VTEEGMAISIFAMPCEIASIVSFPGNERMKQLRGKRGRMRKKL
jgi:hypothetical protein